MFLSAFVLLRQVHIAVARRRSDDEDDVDDIRDREMFDALGVALEWAHSGIWTCFRALLY